MFEGGLYTRNGEVGDIKTDSQVLAESLKDYHRDKELKRKSELLEERS